MYYHERLVRFPFYFDVEYLMNITSMPFSEMMKQIKTKNQFPKTDENDESNDFE